MKLPRIYLALSLALAALLVGAAQVASSQPPAILTDAQAAMLGLEMKPLVDPNAATPVDERAAVLAAQGALQTSEAPAEVRHVVTREFTESPEVTAFVVVFSGGPPVWGGPVGGESSHPTTYRGVVIDDHTGNVLRLFARGQL